MSLLLAILAASAAPLQPPPPLPPAPLWNGERATLPDAKDDMAFIAAQTGRSASNMAMIDWSQELANLAYGRLERDLPRGYVDFWFDDRKRPVLNVVAGFDRAAILRGFSPGLHGALRFRLVANDRAAIARGRAELERRLRGVTGGYTMEFDPQSDRFVVTVPQRTTIARLRRMLPPWLRRVTRFEIGEPPVLV